MRKTIVSLLNFFIITKRDLSESRIPSAPLWAGKSGMTQVLGITVLLLITYLLLPISSNAQQQAINIQFSPNQAELKTNEEKIIKMILSSETGISGLDLKFQTSGLNVTDFRDVLETDTNLNPFEYKQLSESFNGSNPAASYIFTVSNQKLPKTVTLYIKIKGTTTGQGTITLDYNKSQVLNGNNSLLQISPNQSASYDINLSQSSAEFIDPASVPAANYPSSAAVVKIKIRLYGAGSYPNGKIKAIAVVVGRIGEGKYETSPQGFDLIPIDPGSGSGKAGAAFSGTVAFPDFKDGNKFSLMIKVDKYLLRRVCDTGASETRIGEYVCTTPGLTIRTGADNSFDFTGIALLPGDLGLADGVLNGYDLSLVRNNLNKNTPEAVGLADLNYDGAVDKKDFDIIGFVAANTERQADQ